MALLVMIIRKMIRNRWLQLSLLFGLILSVALVGSIPAYTNAILQRMLIKDLELIQSELRTYPGRLTIAFSFSNESHDTRLVRTDRVDDIIRDAEKGGFGLPTHSKVREYRSGFTRVDPVDSERIDSSFFRQADFAALENMEDKIRVIDGRLPAPDQPVDGVYEVLITQQAIFELKVALDETYKMRIPGMDREVLLKPVGVMDRIDYNDFYWHGIPPNRYNRSFIVPFSVFEEAFRTDRVWQLQSIYYHYVFDYHQIKLPDVDPFLESYAGIQDRLSALSYHTRFTSYMVDTLADYEDRERTLRLLLWSMNVPVLIMLAFYLYMVADLIMERQKNEIAVLRSRGASRLQIMLSFLIEGLILSAVALLIGPFVSLFLTNMLGASNGFLEFVNRSALDVRLDKSVYVYGAYTLGAALLMMLIPGFFATRTTIVGHKRKAARKQGMSLLHKTFLDVILLVLAAFGLRNFHQRMELLTTTGLDADAFTVDPLFFLVPTLFTVGFGLLALRLYPLFIRAIYWIGRKWWPPSLYSTLIQVGRSGTQYQFLMLFLILTVATGLFSASAARTMNQNDEDKIVYRYGSDIVMQTFWRSDAQTPVATAPPMPGAPPVTVPDLPVGRVQYVEPDYDAIVRDLPGVEHAAKVFTKRDATLSGAKFSTEATLMAIDTDDFGRTVRFKNGLLDHHLNEYLNLIARDPNAVLVSRSVAEEHGIQPGDQIYVGWSMVSPRTFMVYGIVDYFPSFMPNKESPTAKTPKLVVAHLSTVQTFLSTEPYDIWLKLAPDADRASLIEELKERQISLVSFTDVRGEITKVKNDPFRMAVNGAMTLGFLISVIVSFFGFLLYWVLSLHGRVLQIGIFRAMGISFRQLVAMLAVEQLLTSGAGIAVGLIDGITTSRLFVRFFQLTTDPRTQVPPFEVIFDPRDTTGMFVIVSLMMLIAMAILSWLLSRIRIHQAVKLGED